MTPGAPPGGRCSGADGLLTASWAPAPAFVERCRGISIPEIAKSVVDPAPEPDN